MNIRIVNAATGQLLRELTLNPTATTNPPAAHPDPQKHRSNPQLAGSTYADVLRHHNRRDDSVLAQDIGDRCLKT